MFENLFRNISSKKNKICVYTLGNDAVIEYLTVLFDSFRKYEPTHILKIIPFDENVFETKKIADYYSVELLTGDYTKYDEIGINVCDHHPQLKGKRRYIAVHTFRKFAAFFQESEDFIFLDSDVIICRPFINKLLDADKTDIDYMFFNRSYEGYNFTNRGHEFINEVKPIFGNGFNTAFIYGKKGIFDINVMLEVSRNSDLISKTLSWETFEQPFVNLMLFLHNIHVERFADVIEDACPAWGGRNNLLEYDEDGTILFGKNSKAPGGKPFFVHFGDDFYKETPEFLLEYYTSANYNNRKR